MITRIEIDGFKTFSNFKMEFTPFTVVAGTNASGKSNLFDAMKLLSNLAEMDLKTAFNNVNLRGEAREQFTQYPNGKLAHEIKLAVEILLNVSITDNWGENSTLKYTRLRYELEIERKRNSKGFDDLFITHEVLKPIKHQEDKWIKKNVDKKLLENRRPKVYGRRSVPYIATEEKNKKKYIRISQDGSIGEGGREIIANNAPQTLLSSVDSVNFPHVFATKEEMINWNFLQLNPEELSKPSPRMASDIVTSTGGNLAAALYRLKTDDETILNDISRELNNLLSNFIKVDVIEEVAENKFIIKLISEDGREFSSRVLSEGTLRLLILCILKYDNKYMGTLCFEEPENGIHPFRINTMIELLTGLSSDLFDDEDINFPLRQIIVNTHSATFVGLLFKENNFSKNISVWFSKLVTNMSIKNNNRYQFKTTKILPVRKANRQVEFDFITTKELKMTELEVKKYLETSNNLN